ncbi:Protein of unknown function [Pyronema omphalodes CBS 100304]|uniref:Uncharacterized protein n=1 Tax=Pyronema omphalodes (strain CBS 100304) TaxID=1076935 RepID=U4KZQ9_PYROM|nr:Protein of unknown function [Pyronema omphalodes CBS 100304]
MTNSRDRRKNVQRNAIKARSRPEATVGQPKNQKIWIDSELEDTTTSPSRTLTLGDWNLDRGIDYGGYPIVILYFSVRCNAQ